MLRSTSVTLGVVLTLCVGCARDGEIVERNQTQDVSADGRTATQTRTQTRQTGGGATVKETQTQSREVLKSPTTMPDARQADPAR
ncbi:MAG TPA: hypothetical protein VF624_00560 [Tepidisphaeraceae bacterium]|jgi:hypothetical protein